MYSIHKHSFNPGFSARGHSRFADQRAAYADRGALAQPIILLSDDMATQDISACSLMWLDAQSSSTASQVPARSGSGFATSTAEAVYSLGPKAALWQHYRFTVQAKSHEQWVLEFPQPLLDRITVYQSSAAGKWTSLTAEILYQSPSGQRLAIRIIQAGY